MLKQHILAYPPFRNLWLSNTVSQLGDSFYYILNTFMINRLTHQAAMVGFNGALEGLPFLLLSPYAGVLADRIDRRLLMIASDVVCAALLLILGAIVAFKGQPPVEAILVTSLLTCCARAFFHPARNAAIPRVVPEDRVMEANAFCAMTFNFVFLGGLSVSGVILAILFKSSGHSFYLFSIILNALSFVGSAAFLIGLPQIKPAKDESHVESHPLADLRAGLGYMRQRHDLKVLFVMLLITNLMISPFFPVYVKANELWFNNQPQNLSWWEAGFFAGMVITTAIFGKVKVRHVGWGNIVGYTGIGLSVVLMAVCKSFIGWLAFNFTAGIFGPLAWVPTDSHLQVSVPDAFRGRVQSLRMMTSQGVQPVGLALGGVLIDRFGLEVMFMIMGAGMAAATLVGLADRQFRGLVLEEAENPAAA
jgi:MFS family permease